MRDELSPPHSPLPLLPAPRRTAVGWWRASRVHGVLGPAGPWLQLLPWAATGLPSSEIASRIVAIGAATTDGAGLRAASAQGVGRADDCGAG